MDFMINDFYFKINTRSNFKILKKSDMFVCMFIIIIIICLKKIRIFVIFQM